jgi:hypothetical protein
LGINLKFRIYLHSFAKLPGVVRQCKKTADPQMAHLVFADTQPNAEKPKEPFFATARQKVDNFWLTI